MSEGSLSKAAAAKRPKKQLRGTTSRSASTTTKERKASDKRERILAAAVRVFAKSGFFDARVSDVAKAAGVADGTIYLYFTSKEHLLVSLFEDRVDKLLGFMQNDLGKIGSAKDKLRRVIEVQLGLLEGERDLAEVITVIVRQSSRLLKEYATPKFSAYLDAIARVVAEGQASGEFRTDVSPGLVARATFGALDGVTFTWALGRAEEGALVRAASQIADILLRGLTPSSLTRGTSARSGREK